MMALYKHHILYSMNILYSVERVFCSVEHVLCSVAARGEMAEDDALAKLSVMTSEEKAVKDIIAAEELITSDDSISSKGTEAGMHKFSKNWGR